MLAGLSVALALVYIAGAVAYYAPEATSIALLLALVTFVARRRRSPTKTPDREPET